MSDELLSAMLDGECTPGELKRLLDSLEQSPALKQRWSRMCLVREAMQGTQVRAGKAAPADFCAGVMAAIAKEQDAAPVHTPGKAPSKVVAMPVRRPAAAAAANASRWQPVAGLAAAASIAAVAAVGGYRWISQPVGVPGGLAANTVPASSPVAEQAVAYTGGAPGVAQPRLVAVSTAAAEEPVETRWSQLDADTARQLGEYMMEHSNMRADQGMGGSLSYPRMMLHTAEYRSGERH